MNNKCPKCGRATWWIRVKLEFTAPAKFYGNLGKRARRHRDVNCTAALWETTVFECRNPKCMHHVAAARPMVYADVVERKRGGTP